MPSKRRTKAELSPRPNGSVTDPNVLVCPFTIAVDTREQSPYRFVGLTTNADRGYAPIRVPTQLVSLSTGRGDYSIVELPRIAIERKSKADLYQSISHHRENFERRLALMGRSPDFTSPWVAHVVVEAEISELLGSPPPFSQFAPKSLIRTILAWKVRFPRVQWDFLPGRDVAEGWTFRLLERFWMEFQKTPHDSLT